MNINKMYDNDIQIVSNVFMMYIFVLCFGGFLSIFKKKIIMITIPKQTGYRF